MSQPSVTLNELDGALGILPPSAGELHAIVGVASKTTVPVDTPAAYARIPDIIADFGSGPMVEDAAHYIERYGKQVILVRTGQTTAGSATAIVTAVTGTSVVTRDVAVVPVDDFEVVVRVIAGGTIGVEGITLQWSLDGGRSWSAIYALGTAVNYTIPAVAPSGTSAPGLKFDFAAGTLIAGDSWSTRTTAPQWNATEIGTALDALKASVLQWRQVHVTGIIDATLFDTVDGKIVGMAAGGDYKSWIGSVRKPNIAESDSTYQTSIATAFAAKTTVVGMLCAGAGELTSSVSGRKYLRPAGSVIAAREASVDVHIDTAAIRLGALPGISIKDDDGNPKHHDETTNPGLDDARFACLRTWKGRPGVFINNPRIFSSSTSDFQFTQHRRVMNVARRVTRITLEEVCSEPILCDPTTGRIAESEAKSIEARLNAALRAALPRGKVSQTSFVLNRTDNVLATLTLRYQTRVMPMGYPKFLVGDIAFENPALKVQAAPA